MIIGNNFSSYIHQYYNSLSIEQKERVDFMCSELGVSMSEISYYFQYLNLSLGNINFFAFVFLIYKNPAILQNLRMINANFVTNSNFELGESGGYNFVTNPLNPNPSKSCISPSKGDAFLTAFSPEQLKELQDGRNLNLKDGIINSIKDLAKFDKNGDGKISGNELKNLQIAVDSNKDGKISKDEIKGAIEAGAKEIDINTGKVTTNDGKTFNLNEGKINVGENNKTDNRKAVTIDTDRSGGQTKDNNNRLEPGSNQLGNSNNQGSSSTSSSSTTSSSSNSGKGGSSGSSNTSSSGRSGSSSSSGGK